MPLSERNPNVFVSHSYNTESIDIVNQLFSECLKYEIDIIFDRREEDIAIGKKVTPIILEQIEQCDCFILFMSEEAMNSKWVLKELAHYEMIQEKRNFDNFIIVYDKEETFRKIADHENLSYLEDKKSIIYDSQREDQIKSQIISVIWRIHSKKLLWEQKARQQQFVSTVFERTNDDYENFFKEKISNAKKEIILFGTGRQFYFNDNLREILLEKAKQIPVRIYALDPRGISRKQRYRFEPQISPKQGEAILHRNQDFFKGVLQRIYNLGTVHNVLKTDFSKAFEEAGLYVYLHDINLTFVIEKIDDTILTMNYGYYKRGSESPIYVHEKEVNSFESKTYSYYKYSLANIEEQHPNSSIIPLYQAMDELQKELGKEEVS